MKPKFDQTPTSPGIYRFLNKKEDTIYIGKAKNLRSRLRSYWSVSSGLTPAKQQMVKEIANIDLTVLNNETEALLLEAGLIKKYQPKYNIVLRDDKNWTYIVITDEAFPRIVTTHGNQKRKGMHFGPYTSTRSAKTLVRLIHQIVPLRTCRRDLSKLPNGRVCFQYHLYRCLGPCEKKISTSQYDILLKQVVDILKGNGRTLYQKLKKEMIASSKSRQYEKAANIRDKIKSWDRVFVPQHVMKSQWLNRDVVAAITIDKESVITVMQIRHSQIMDKFSYTIRNPLKLPLTEVLASFLLQYYSGPRSAKPKELILSHIINQQTQHVLGRVKISVPQRGHKKKQIEIAEKNAWLHYQTTNKLSVLPSELHRLQTLLQLPELPIRIEGYDISNFAGDYAVGSMVVFVAGKIDPSSYRKFKVKGIKGPNDVMMLREVLARRSKHKGWPQPQLIVLDGGKPQLNTVYPVLPDNWKKRVLGLAKRQEEIFLPGKRNSIRLAKHDPALQLLQRVRDQAHKQARTYYQLLHKKGYKQR